MKYFLIILYFISNISFADEVYKGKDCFVYAEIVKFVEYNRDNGVKKEELSKKIIVSTLDQNTKQIFLKNINFLYNNKDLKNYGVSLRKQCQSNGIIKFLVVENANDNQSREKL